jgi:hypothetical protein
VQHSVVQPLAGTPSIGSVPIDAAEVPPASLSIGARLHQLIAAGHATLPLPGRGHTLTRWRALCTVASEDLALAKLYEGHTDAIAILAELGVQAPTAARAWGMWAAEPPRNKVRLQRDADGTVTLHGTKAWCSGAAIVDDALLTCWDGDAGPFLAAVDMAQPGVAIAADGWNAVGMAATASVAVTFTGARARVVGASRAYLERAGFWHGGAGIAACWYGGALALAEELARHLGPEPDAFRLAHLGAVDCALGQAAAWIDRYPDRDAQGIALRARAVVEDAALAVLDHAGKALGASAFCLNARFARAAADLPVYLRQSHAQRDLAALGQRVRACGAAWTL